MSEQTKGNVYYERRPELDKRITNGDDFAGDAYVRWVAVGHTPNDERDRAELIEALRAIEIWFGMFPPSGHFYEDGTEMSYGAAFGSNGERDYMRGIARALLARFAPNPMVDNVKASR